MKATYDEDLTWNREEREDAQRSDAALSEGLIHSDDVDQDALRQPRTPE